MFAFSRTVASLVLPVLAALQCLQAVILHVLSMLHYCFQWKDSFCMFYQDQNIHICEVFPDFVPPENYPDK